MIMPPPVMIINEFPKYGLNNPGLMYTVLVITNGIAICCKIQSI